MNDLKRRFVKFREEFPYLGDVIIMSMSVEDMKYSKDTIRMAFSRLVSKEEYEQEEKREIINSLYNYSNGK